MKFFKNKNTSIRSSQGYSDVAAPGAGGSDPADTLAHKVARKSMANWAIFFHLITSRYEKHGVPEISLLN